MLRRSILYILSLTVASCMGNDGLRTDAMANNNIWGISRISEGMSEQEVMRYMGKPFEYETFCAGEDIYDIWFYVTQPTVLGQTRMVHQNLTPLTFKNGLLVGWGYQFYEKARYVKSKTDEKNRATPTKTDDHTEEHEIEHTLKSTDAAQTSNMPGRQPASDEPKNLKIKPWEPKNPNQPKKPNPPNSPKPADKKTEPPADGAKKAFDKEGNQMLEGESEQDFNFW